MAIYKCPFCAEEIPKDILVYKEHMEKHVVDEIKREHPEWKTENGICPQCVDFFRNQIRGND